MKTDGKLDTFEAHFFEFTINRTESSFAPRKGTRGRIEVRPDFGRNVPMIAHDGTSLLTPRDLAEYLLEPVEPVFG